MTLNPEDDGSVEEPAYGLLHFSNDILEILEKRDTELSFKDLNQEQLAIRLDNSIKELPNLLRVDYDEAKKKMISVATDLYELISQMAHEEKEKGNHT